MNISLIANTGIQFFTTDFEIKAEESFIDKDGNFLSPLSIKDENGYDMPLVFHESYNIMDDIWTLEMAVNFSGGQIVRLDELRNHKPIPYLYTNALGIECLVDENKIDFNELDVIDEESCYSDYCFAGSITERLTKGNCPLDTIENQWLPMPMFEKDSSGNSVFGPTGWCRMKLVPVSKIKNLRRYHIVWAFDTTSIKNDLSGVKPFFYEGEVEKHYSISKDISLLFNFFSPKPYDCEWVDEYIATLIHGNKENTELISSEGEASHFRYIAYYITIVSYLQKMGLTPEVTLYTDDEDSKQVDLVLDIGNSRTCGVLFESADFTKVDMLQLQDMSEPWKVYKKPFDMRLAFHHCKFGEMDITDQFTWQSFLRIGDEAIKLIYKSRPANGVAQRTTNYSSPKRYLWDDKQFDGQWDFLTTDEDENSTLNHYINIKGLSEQFDSDGSLRKNKNGGIFSSFSRRSLMTFVLIEILQQANCQINSQSFREKHGDVNIPRKLKNILITCPTAMPKEEQVILRQCAEEAYIALLRCKDPELYYQPYNPEEWKGKIQIIPSVKDLMTSINGPMQQRVKTEWGYDEATCCQLVYLYAEVAQRYLNHCEDFFNLYGHVRKEFIEEDYNRNSLTIGSIDIGAGTTDLMICAYKYDEKGHKLGEWCRKQRTKRTKLSTDRRKKLEAINFRLEIRKSQMMNWEEWYNLLTSYYQHHGNAEVPTTFKTTNGYEYDEEGIQLGGWVNNTRTNQNKLTEEQRRKLETIDFRFEKRKKNIINWENWYKLLKAYYQRHGNTEVPSYFKTINGYDYDEDGCKLGRWCAMTRKRKNNLTKERLNKLELIGFRFIKKKENEENKKNLCSKYKIDYSKYTFLENISYIELYSKIMFLIDNKYPLEVNNKLNEIFYMSNENMKQKYNISKEELITKYYINEKERGV